MRTLVFRRSTGSHHPAADLLQTPPLRLNINHQQACGRSELHSHRRFQGNRLDALVDVMKIPSVRARRVRKLKLNAGSNIPLNFTLSGSSAGRSGRATVKRTELLGPAWSNHHVNASAFSISLSSTFRITSPARSEASAAGLPGAIDVSRIPR